MLCDYLVQILTARVYDVTQETPLEYAPNLSARLNNKLLLKGGCAIRLFLQAVECLQQDGATTNC
jgi:threonine dehydratase